MESPCMEQAERQADFETQAGQADMLQALRSACLPDDFWMYSYKILPCPHGYRHSWTHCPFSHTGETARRRCPRTHAYAPDPCAHARSKRPCPNSDACPFAHNTFEQWLHPARYRTRLCYLGANCRRPTCFFAHSVEELRSVEDSETNGSTTLPPPSLPSPSLLQYLPLPPPLPAPSANTTSTPAPPSGDSASAPLPVLQPMATPAAAALSPPLGTVTLTQLGGAVLQPVAFLCMQQPSPLRPPSQSGVNCQLQQPTLAHGAYFAYPGRPALPRPPPSSLPLSLSEPSPGGQHMTQHLPQATMSSPPSLIPMAMALHSHGPRSHMTAGHTVAVAPLHPSGGAVHLAPAGTMYINGCMAQVRPGTQLMPMHAAPPPPPLPHGFPTAAAASGYMINQRGSDGAPSNVPYGRFRSYSNPGEGEPQLPTAGGMRVSGSGDPYGAPAHRYPPQAQVPLTMLVPPPQPHSPSEYKSRSAFPAARHMPAPTNRGVNNMRRVSHSPADSPLVDSPPTAAAAAAAAAATARRYADLDMPSATDAADALLSSLSDFLPHASSPVLKSSYMPQSHSATDALDAAFCALQLSRPIAAPPTTPSASSFTAANSSPSYSLSAHSSPLPTLAPGTAGAGAAQHGGWLPPSGTTSAVTPASSRDMALAMLRSPSVSSDGSATFSRNLSAGSATSGTSLRSPSRVTAFDAHAANAAAVLAAAVSADAPPTPPASSASEFLTAAAVAMMANLPYDGALLQQSGSDASGDLYGMDDMAEHTRFSDPGPALRAAIRRISSELGSAAVGRNSDPGQAVTGASSLLLPLLQSVLAEGLASGQFELVNGQLQMKGVVGGCSVGGGGVVADPSSGAGVGATWRNQAGCSEPSEL